MYCFEKEDLSTINVMLNCKDVSEYLKISADGLEVNNFKMNLILCFLIGIDKLEYCLLQINPVNLKILAYSHFLHTNFYNNVYDMECTFGLSNAC